MIGVVASASSRRRSTAPPAGPEEIRGVQIVCSLVLALLPFVRVRNLTALFGRLAGLRMLRSQIVRELLEEGHVSVSSLSMLQRLWGLDFGTLEGVGT